MSDMTRDKFYDIVLRYEGAVSRVERDGDDSEEAVQELEAARSVLLDIMRKVKDAL